MLHKDVRRQSNAPRSPTHFFFFAQTLPHFYIFFFVYSICLYVLGVRKGRAGKNFSSLDQAFFFVSFVALLSPPPPFPQKPREKFTLVFEFSPLSPSPPSFSRGSTLGVEGSSLPRAEAQRKSVTFLLFFIPPFSDAGNFPLFYPRRR